jgi:hypothetical protein
MLEKICQEYLTEFESSLVQLDVVNSRLEQRMKLNKREEAIVSAPNNFLFILTRAVSSKLSQKREIESFLFHKTRQSKGLHI